MIDIEVKGIEALLHRLDGKAYDTILIRTVNKTAAQAKTAADKSIRSRYKIKKSDLGLKLYKAKKSLGIAVIGAKKKRIGLIKFRARQTKNGVSAEIKKGGRHVIPSSFIADVGSTSQVFKRRGKARLPIVSLQGPSAGIMLQEPETIKAILKTVHDKMPTIFKHEHAHYFSR